MFAVLSNAFYNNNFSLLVYKLSIVPNKSMNGELLRALTIVHE